MNKRAVLISQGPATVTEYLAKYRAAMERRKAMETVVQKARALKAKRAPRRRKYDPVELLEHVTGRDRSPSGYVLGD